MFSLKEQFSDGLKVLFLRGLSAISSFYLVRISVDELGQSNYGIWIALYSVVAWFSVVDLGIPSVIKNIVAKTFNKSDNISNLHLLLASINRLICRSLPVLLILIILIYFSGYVPDNLASNIFSRLVILISIGVLGMLVSKTIISFFSGLGIHHFESLNSFLVNIILILFLYVFNINLTFYACLIVFSPLIVSGFFFIKKFGSFLKLVTRSLIKEKDLLLNNSNSKSFLIIQIAALILFSTDYYLILFLFNDESVWHYFSVTKYYSVISIIGGAAVYPLWMKIASHSSQQVNFKRILMPQLIVVFILLIVALFMFVNERYFMTIWLDDKYIDNINLSLVVVINCLINLFVAPFVMIINGLEFLKIQKFTSAISAIINIPLSIFFASKFGLLGVPLATTVSLSYSLILRPVQVYFIFKKRGGIWTK